MICKLQRICCCCFEVGFVLFVYFKFLGGVIGCCWFFSFFLLFVVCLGFFCCCFLAGGVEGCILCFLVFCYFVTLPFIYNQRRNQVSSIEFVCFCKFFV